MPAGTVVSSGSLVSPGGQQGIPGPSAGVSSSSWTVLSAASGWTAGSPLPQYRIETLGSVQTVFCRGIIQAAYSALGTTAFTFPSTAFPSAIRWLCLSGYQNTGTASDVAAYIANVSTAGVVVIYFLGASAFVYADKSQTQMVYLDGLIFSI